MRKEDLRERLIHTILVTVILFMLCCVTYKQLFHYTNWLELSLMYSIAWGVGIFIRKSLNTEEKVFTAFLVAILTSFICSIVFDLPEWLKISLHISIPFTISMLLV